MTDEEESNILITVTILLCFFLVWGLTNFPLGMAAGIVGLFVGAYLDLRLKRRRR